jgi:hypothetical protein
MMRLLSSVIKQMKSFPASRIIPWNLAGSRVPFKPRGEPVVIMTTRLPINILAKFLKVKFTNNLPFLKIAAMLDVKVDLNIFLSAIRYYRVCE